MEQSSTLLTTVIVPLATAVAAFIGGLVAAIFQAHGSIKAAHEQAEAAVKSAERQAAAAIASAEKQAEAAIRASSEASKSAIEVVMLEHKTAVEREERAAEARKRSVAAALMSELLAIRSILHSYDKSWSMLEVLADGYSKNSSTAGAQLRAPSPPKISTPIFDAHVEAIGLLEPLLSRDVALTYARIGNLLKMDEPELRLTPGYYTAAVKGLRQSLQEIISLIDEAARPLAKVAGVTPPKPST